MAQTRGEFTILYIPGSVFHEKKSPRGDKSEPRDRTPDVVYSKRGKNDCGDTGDVMPGKVRSSNPISGS